MKILKNRFFIGTLCIVLALLFSFVAVPALQGVSQSSYTDAVRMKTAVQNGTQISADMLETVKVPAGIVKGSISDSFSVLGRYATTDLYAGDYLTLEKLTATQEKTDTISAGASKGKMVVSVTLPSLASGVSGRLLPGDVVTAMALPNGEKNQALGLEPDTEDAVATSGAVIYPELKYLEVCMVTASDGSNADVKAEPTDKKKNTLPVTVSFYADEAQAVLLAGLQQQGTIYLAFVARGEAAAAYIPDNQRVFNMEVK